MQKRNKAWRCSKTGLSGPIKTVHVWGSGSQSSGHCRDGGQAACKDSVVDFRKGDLLGGGV